MSSRKVEGRFENLPIGDMLEIVVYFWGRQFRLLGKPAQDAQVSLHCGPLEMQKETSK